MPDAAGPDPSLSAPIARFNALSDDAGNPGAPTSTHWDASNPPPIPDPTTARTPGTPEGALSYALGEAERRARPQGDGYDPLTARDVLAGLTELGWTLHPGLPHPAVLAQIHERLDRIEYVTENIAAAVDNPTPADRTLSAMDRVTQWDAEQVIRSVLQADDHPTTRLVDPAARYLAERIAQALYGPTTEMAPVTPPDPYANETVASIIALADSLEGTPAGDLLEAAGRAMSGHDEGAPTEGDGRRPLDLRGHACTRPVGPVTPPYGEPPACGQPATEVDSIGRPRCPEHLAQAQNATSVDDEGDG